MLKDRAHISQLLKIVQAITVILLSSGCSYKEPDAIMNESIGIQQPEIEYCGNSSFMQCPEYLECINDKCMLKEANYRYGLVYIYNTPDTHNPNWKTEFENIILKVDNSLKEITDNKLNVSIELIGEVQTDIFCWNPATVGGTVNRFGTESYFVMPGSNFGNSGIGLNGEIIKSYCDNCIMKDGAYSIDCDSPLTNKNLLYTNKLNMLRQQITKELGTDLNDYGGVFIVFGRLGQVLPDENDENLEYRCNTLAGIISGKSNLVMAENSIKAGGLVPCNRLSSEKRSYAPFYDIIGWHSLAHEILHNFGAVDIYGSGPVIGLNPNIKSDRQLAEELDPKAQESIMGNEDRSCMEEGSYEKDGVICTPSELERVYLDRYNRQIIGLE